MNRTLSISQTIKMISFAAALSAAVFATPSFAAVSSAPAQISVQAQAQAQRQEKTRTEVYQELVSAEKDGSLARANATYTGA